MVTTKAEKINKDLDYTRFTSEKNSCLKNSNASLDLFTATLPGGNCLKMEDNLCQGHSPKVKPIQNLSNVMKIPTKPKRKISVKNEKKVDRGELDEIFDRILMKKKLQK